MQRRKPTRHGTRWSVIAITATLVLAAFAGCRPTGDPFDSLPAEINGAPMSYVEGTDVNAPPESLLDANLRAAGYGGSQRRDAVGRVTEPRLFEIYAHEVIGAGPDLLDLVYDSYRFEPVTTERVVIDGKAIIRLTPEGEHDFGMVFYRFGDTVVVLYGSGFDVDDALRQLP